MNLFEFIHAQKKIKGIVDVELYILGSIGSIVSL